MPFIVDLSATHYDDASASSGSRGSSKRYFHRIPFHREDPDYFNNDVFGWTEGGNGTLLVEFSNNGHMSLSSRPTSGIVRQRQHTEGEERPLPLSPADDGNNSGGGAPPPRIWISNTIITSDWDGGTTVPPSPSSTSSSSSYSPPPLCIFLPLESILTALRAEASAGEEEEGARPNGGGSAVTGGVSLSVVSTMQGEGATALPTVMLVGSGERGGEDGGDGDKRARRVAASESTAAIGRLSPSSVEASHAIIKRLSAILSSSLPSSDAHFLTSSSCRSLVLTLHSRGAGAAGSLARTQFTVCGMVLGATNVPRDLLYSSNTSSAASCSDGHSGAGANNSEAEEGGRCAASTLLPLSSVVVAPICIATNGHVSSNTLPHMPFSCTPSRVLLLRGAAVVPSSVVDVSHTVTPDSPFYPGGQRLLVCPAAAARRAAEMRMEASEKWGQSEGAAAEQKNKERRAGVEEDEEVMNGPHNDPFILVGCDVGTHVDSPQHFFADADHKGITDLKASGGVVAMCGCGHANTSPSPSSSLLSELVAPLVLVDVRQQCAEDADYLVTVADVRAAALRVGRARRRRMLEGRAGGREEEGAQTAHNDDAAPDDDGGDDGDGDSLLITRTLANSLVVAMTGWSAKFHEATAKRRPEIYQGIAAPPSCEADGSVAGSCNPAAVAHSPKMHFPGFHPDTAKFLINLPTPSNTKAGAADGGGAASPSPCTTFSVAAIGIDTLSLDRGLSEDFATHQVMLGDGNRYQVENLNLSALVGAGASLRGGGDDGGEDYDEGGAEIIASDWYAFVLPIAAEGAFEAMGRVMFARMTVAE